MQNETLKHQNIFVNVLQMFYFTCNHGLTALELDSVAIL